jgi:hypothetical protein
VDGIEISFPGKELGDSTQLARELRDKLRGDGVPDAALSIMRERTDTMDLGTVLHLALQYVEHVTTPATLMVEMATITYNVYELCFREHCGLKVKVGGHILEFGPGEIELEKLRTVLDEAFNAANR